MGDWGNRLKLFWGGLQKCGIVLKMVDKSVLLMAKAKVSLTCLVATADLLKLSTCIESVSVMSETNGTSIIEKDHFLSNILKSITACSNKESGTAKTPIQKITKSKTFKLWSTDYMDISNCT